MLYRYPVAALLILCLLLCSSATIAQKVNWSKRLNGVTGDYHQIGALEASDSSLYSFGWSTQGLEFESLVAPSGYYLTRHTSTGAQRWVATIPASPALPNQSFFQPAAALRVNTNGEIIIAGHIRKQLTFGTGVGQKILDADTYVGQSITGLDIPFLARYTKAGAFLDARILAAPALSTGGNLDVIAHDLTSDGSGNVYVVMKYQDSVVVDKGLATQRYFGGQLPRNFNGSYLVCKYDSQLKLKWVRNLAGASLNLARNISIALMDPTHLAVSGTFEGSLQFRNATSVFVNLSSYQPGSTATTGESAFLAKLDTAGTFIWAKRPMEKPVNIADDGRYVNDLDTDSEGNIYLAGSLGGAAIFGLGTPQEVSVPWNTGVHYVISKFDKDGNFKWMKMGMSFNGPYFAAGRKITCNPQGQCVIGGEFAARQLRVNGTAEIFNTESDNYSVYQVLYDAAGQYIRGAHLANSGTGGTVYGGRPTNLLTALHMKSPDKVYSAGNFFFSLIVAQGFTNQNILSADNLSTDIFMSSIAMIAPPPPPPDEVTGIESPATMFSVYPNPARDQVTVRSGSDRSDDTFHLLLTDLHGRALYQSPAVRELNLSLNSYPSGMYVLRISTPSGRSEIHRLIVP